MYAFAVVQKGTFAVLYAYLIYIGLQRMDFVAAKSRLFFQVKAQNFFHHPFAGGQWGDFDMLFARAALKCLMSLWSLRFGQVEQIEMVVTVPLTLINNLELSHGRNSRPCIGSTYLGCSSSYITPSFLPVAAS